MVNYNFFCLNKMEGIYIQGALETGTSTFANEFTYNNYRKNVKLLHNQIPVTGGVTFPVASLSG